ncbi:MAG TPA: CPBP family intramembrane glutamic endopeptidase [Candidatus Acidoferrum sp.]|nr:CPBP family intramembrane glutamic endopeptidase [Candidatus Acidoferrum sp.]
MPWDFWIIFFVLGVLLPWRGHLRLKKLLALPQISSRERLLLYLSTITFQWVAVAITAWRSWVRGLTLEELGLVVHGAERILLVAITGAGVLGGLQWLNLRRMGRSSGRAREFLQLLAERIFPRSRKELALFLALAATAGLCEEFLYRGFAMAALTRAGLPVWGVVLLSSVLFGLAHLYQGRGGLLSTLVIGTVFGTARIAYDGLLPAIVWHFAVDAVAGLAGPRYLLLPRSPTIDTAKDSPVGL